MLIKKFKVASLFSGIGGFEEGLKKSNINFEVVFASEIDKYARQSYKLNFTDKNLYGDITKIDEKDIPDHDILCAGFPCQAFSIAGKRRGFNDTRGTLFFEVARILKEKKPKYIILENVKNLISHDKSNTLKIILSTLSDLGYTVDFTVINSMESGVPQNRDRTYIVGIYKYNTQEFNTDTRNKKVNELKKWYRSNMFQSFNFFDTLSFDANNLVINDILENNVDNKYYFDNKSIKQYLGKININYLEERQQKIVKILDLPKEVYNDLERQRRVYSPYGISPTILARTDSTKVLLKVEEGYCLRKFTPLENFLVQGFDLDFINNLRNSKVSDTQMYKQSGNAVSPPVITGIVNHLTKFLLERKEKEIRFIDLFSGIGGFRLTFESLGCKCVFSSDIDKNARETYKENFGEEPKGDITKINENHIPDHDILCAGFPCQPFSLAGKRLGFEDTRGTLFFEVARIIKSKKPKVVFLENVAGIVNHDKGNTIKVIEATLKNLGYILKWEVMNAYNFGVPQNRNRWYCIAIRNDINITGFEFPKKIKLSYKVKDILLQNVEEKYSITEISKNNIEKHLPEFVKSKRYIEGAVILANEIRASRCNFRCDGISPCLTAKMGTGGNNIPVLVSEFRKLTERECLNLMGFPSWYRIKENNMQSYKQIGNSVVVPVIKLIAEEVMKQIFKL